MSELQSAKASLGAGVLRVSHPRPPTSRTLTLPFSCPFVATKTSKRQQRATKSEGRKSPDSMIDGARCGNVRRTRPQRTANVSFSACAWRIAKVVRICCGDRDLARIEQCAIWPVSFSFADDSRPARQSRRRRAVVAESVIVKQQLLILNRSRKRSRNLRTSDRVVAGRRALVVRPGRLLRSAIVVKPLTLVSLHRALIPT
jgi:hypothetical protein